MIYDILIITSQSALAQQDDGLRAPAYRPALSVFLLGGLGVTGGLRWL